MQANLRPGGALRRSAVIGSLLASIAPCVATAAELHEIRQGDLVLRSALVARGELDPATAARHDIPAGRNRAVLSVTLLRAADGKSVRATATAATRGEGGARQKILLREVVRDGQTSYIGSFGFTPRQDLQFVVEARPAQGKDRPLLSLAYRERMPPQ